MKTLKKLVIVSIVILALTSLTSCTDTNEELINETEERIEERQSEQIEYFVDPKKVKPPTNG